MILSRDFQKFIPILNAITMTKNHLEQWIKVLQDTGRRGLV